MAKNKTDEISLDTVITDVDQQGPKLKQIVEQHRKYLSPPRSLNFVREAQTYLNRAYAENNAQTDREKMSVVKHLRLETPFDLGYTTDLMEKEPNIAIEIYEVAYVQQKAKELANNRNK